MIINYDIEKIRGFLNDFYRITGLTISVWDADMNQLAFQPSPMAEFCALIKSTPSGKKRCLQSDRTLCSDCGKANTSLTHKCHAGLVDTAIPIHFKGHILGYIMFGQVKDTAFPKASEEELTALGRELKLPADRLISSYQSLESFSPEIIRAAANILSSAIKSLYLDEYIKFAEDELITAIDNYITQNIQNPVSVSHICDEFHISKNRLYSLWNTWFGNTIGNYILEKRMTVAAKLLTGSDKKIKQICIDVGIPDYNYFTKVFKKYYGATPKDYRKQFPILLGKTSDS